MAQQIPKVLMLRLEDHGWAIAPGSEISLCTAVFPKGILGINRALVTDSTTHRERIPIASQATATVNFTATANLCLE
jgi:hypothetical protein